LTSVRFYSQNPELLTVNQVAELLGISPRLVWLLAKQGTLPPVRIRRCTRWRRADVLAFIDQLTEQSPKGHSPDKGVAHGV
jgi:excisionase family DNA binding protein